MKTVKELEKVFSKSDMAESIQIMITDLIGNDKNITAAALISPYRNRDTGELDPQVRYKPGYFVQYSTIERKYGKEFKVVDLRSGEELLLVDLINELNERS